MRRRLLVDLVALVVVGSTVVGWGAAAGARYGVVDLGTLGGNSSVATAINGSGVVVGTSRLPGSEVTHAFLYSGGRMRDLGTLPGKENSAAAAVNSAGDVAGTSWRNEATEAFRSGPGGVSRVRGPDPAVPLSTATGIDDAGDVVGSVVVGTEPGKQPVGVSSGPAGAHLLDPAGGAVPAGVSSAGDVVGSVTVGGASRAFVEHGGARTELGTLGPGGSSVASAVNDAGTVVGWSTSGPGGVARAFLYAGGRMVDLGLPRDTESEARALNDAGQIVGDFFDAGSGQSHAFLYDNGAAVDLNSLIDSGSGWILEQATGINDRGEIVGVGSHDGATRAFLLTPGTAVRSVAASSPAPPPGPAQALPVRRPAAAAVDPSLQVVVENPDFSLQAVGPDGTAYGVPVTNDDEIMRSSDEGATWTRVYSFPSSFSLWYISALSDGTLLASVDTGSWTIWRSTDRGSSWTQVLSLPSAPVFYRTLTPHSIAEGHGFVWLGTYNNGSATVTNYVYRSADDGRTWSVTNTTTTHRHIHGLGFNPADGKLYVFFGDSDGDGVWVSSDNGQTLSPLCTQYACTTIDAAFDPAGSFAIFGQDNYTSQNHIVRLDLATGALTTVRDLPYDSFASMRVGGTYLVGTTHESGVPVTDPNLHLYASNNGGSSFTDVFQRALAYTTGTASLQVQFAFPNGDVPIQIGGYGTIVGRLSAAALPPVNTSLPAISGSAVVGQLLSASTGTWSGSPTGFAYEWRRCDAAGGSCAAISAATASGYTLVAADVGHTLRIAVTASNSAGSATAISAQSAVVAAAAGGSFGQSQIGTLIDTGEAGYLDVSGPFAVFGPVSVSQLNGYMAGGSAASRIRGVIYADSGGQPGAFVAATTEVSVAANRAAGWVVLPLASPVQLAAGSYWLGYWYADGNGRHYYVSVAGAARYKAVAYSATGNPPASFGSASSSSGSYSLTASYVAAVSPPVNTSLPAISGSAVVGQLLSASTGTWSGSPTGFAYEWRRCDAAGGSCAAISAATASGYTLVAADVGHTLRIAVTASNSAGSATAISAQSAVVAAAAGGSFGQSQIGTLIDTGEAGYLDVSGPYTVSGTVSVSQLNGYMAGGSAASRIRGVIYTNSSGQPGTLVAATTEVSVAANRAAGWVVLPLSAPVQLAAGSYWLGYWYADANSRHYYLTVTGAERYKQAAYSATANPPTSFGSASSSTSSYSLTAVYSLP